MNADINFGLSGWTILFDLDGTLVETAPDLCATLNHVIVEDGLNSLNLDDIRSMIGEGARALIRKAFTMQDVTLNASREDRLFDQFLEYYAANIADNSYTFAYVTETLEQLKLQGATMAVCTNKTQRLSEELLETLELTQYFTTIMGRDKTSQHKPAPNHIWECISAANGKPDKAIMIGDSNTDAKAAQAAGVPFLFLEYGYHGGQIDTIKADVKLKDAQALFVTIMRVAAKFS